MKKFWSYILCIIFAFSVMSNFRVSAIDWSKMLPNAIGSTIVGAVPRILGNMWDYMVGAYEYVSNYMDVKKYSGFRKPEEIIKRLKLIVENESEIKIYGQANAKKQLVEALSGAIVRISKEEKSDVKERRGNIVYLIGPSGVGKTKMCYAIADAFLKHPDKTVFFCHSESITDEAELGGQLFKTVFVKDIGKRRSKNIFTGTDGLITKDEESPMLKHLLKYFEAVVIIDEYDKMKRKSKIKLSMYGSDSSGGIDNSADEVLRAISSTGKYKFMNKEVDCSKVLFLITTNESRKSLEENFGIGGIQGGGVQRLNIIEFDYLSLEACRGIVNDMIIDVNRVLMDKNGPFKLNSVTFDKKSIEQMSKYIFEDKVMQGRAKNKLEDKIYSLFSKDIGLEYNKNAKVAFVISENNDSNFSKQV